MSERTRAYLVYANRMFDGRDLSSHVCDKQTAGMQVYGKSSNDSSSAAKLSYSGKALKGIALNSRNSSQRWS